MSGLEHPNLVEMKGICMEPMCLILDFMNMGDLYSFIHTDKFEGLFPPEFMVKIGYDIAKGIRFF